MMHGTHTPAYMFAAECERPPIDEPPLNAMYRQINGNGGKWLDKIGDELGLQRETRTAANPAGVGPAVVILEEDVIYREKLKAKAIKVLR